MKRSGIALMALTIGLMGCSKTNVVENNTTTEILTNDVDSLNVADNATDANSADLNAGNAAGNSL